MNLPKIKSPIFAVSSFQKNTNYRNDTLNLLFNTAYERWSEILESLGINESYLKNKHGPCPGCGGKDRFRFDDKGKGMFFCNKFGSGDGIKLLQHCNGWNFKEACDRVNRILGIRTNLYNNSNPKPIYCYLTPAIKNISDTIKTNLQKQKTSLRLEKIWQTSQPITIGDPVDRYFQSRGIKLDTFPFSLRFNPSLPYFENNVLVGNFPAIIGLVTDIHNHGITLHRTYLGDEGKAKVTEPKKLMSPIIAGTTKGAAIRLYEPEHGILAIGEGIETCLSFHIATNLPIWASVNAFEMERIILPPTVTEVVIAVDNDSSGRGQQAALNLSRRLITEGKKVKRVMPPKADSDFNDMLLETSR